MEINLHRVVNPEVVDEVAPRIRILRDSGVRVDRDGHRAVFEEESEQVAEIEPAEREMDASDQIESEQQALEEQQEQEDEEDVLFDEDDDASLLPPAQPETAYPQMPPSSTTAGACRNASAAPP